MRLSSERRLKPARQGRMQVESLTRRAQLSNATRALEQAVSRVEGLIKKMTAVSAQLPAELAKFAPIEQRYRTITELMRGAVNRQQSIYGGDRAFVARSQIAGAVNQASGEAEQLHGSVQSSYADFDVKASAASRELVELRQSCATASTAVEETAQATLLPRWNLACLTLVKNSEAYQNNLIVWRKAYAHDEEVWRDEQSKQAILVRSADNGAR
jgi:DNA repair ATPase RecN